MCDLWVLFEENEDRLGVEPDHERWLTAYKSPIREEWKEAHNYCSSHHHSYEELASSRSVAKKLAVTHSFAAPKDRRVAVGAKSKLRGA